MEKEKLRTRTLHHDRRLGTEAGAVHQPIHSSAEFAYSSAQALIDVFQGGPGYTYARQNTPTVASLEHHVNMVEQGVGTICFASGMAALTAVFLTLLKNGDQVISSRYLFGNTNSVFQTLENFGIEVVLVDACSVEQVEKAWQPNTRMVFAESIANPGTQIAHLDEIGSLCQSREVPFVLDNTLSTAYLAPGKQFQAALVVNSLSKIMAGHGNVLGGAVTDTGCYDWAQYPNIFAPYRTGDPAQWALSQIRKKGLRDMGAALSGEAAHKIAIGLETLELRLRQANQSALRLARFLQDHAGVQKVFYPGLGAHPQHERAKAYFNGHYGTLLSFELCADIDLQRFLNRLQVIILSTHLGDSRSLILPVAQTIYHEMGPEMRALMNIDERLLRLSIGLECVEDLENDLHQALVFAQGV